MGESGGVQVHVEFWDMFSHCGDSVFFRGIAVPLSRLSPNHLAMEAAGWSGGHVGFRGWEGGVWGSN